jgi:UPF0755 protein
LILCFSIWFAAEFLITPRTETFEKEFRVPKGSSAFQIAKDLENKGILGKRWPFLLAYRLFYSSRTLKAGEYIFSGPLSARDVLQILTEGKIRLHPVTVPEGLTRREMAVLLQSELSLEQEELLKIMNETESIEDWDSEAENLEGYLFPETYHFPGETTAREVVSAMVAQFRRVFDENWRTRADELGMTVRQVVILASLIEKETSLTEEKEIVSSVFHNRLRIGMKLDCDPTIIYVLKEEGTFKGNLRYRHLKMDSPYNTYIYGGLPPGPIANPGRDSLRAALYPTDEEYLYFVSKNDGSHHFSKTIREHQQAVNLYQRRKENE